MISERFGILKMCYGQRFYFRKANLERMVQKYKSVVASNSPLNLGTGYLDYMMIGKWLSRQPPGFQEFLIM